jgi:hypothetical protein
MLQHIKKSLMLAGVSAGFMYLFDPSLGKRRRSLLRDKITRARHKTRKAADVAFRDLAHRAYGTLCELRGMFRGRDTSDEVVVDRVRAKLGRYISHPSSVEVHVRDGCATLSGSVLASEVGHLLRAIRWVDGVREVENRLNAYPTSGNMSTLQGGRRRGGEPAEFRQANWSPSARLIAGATGSLLMINCLAKRTPMAMVFGTAGFVVVLRAISNWPISTVAQPGTGVPGGNRQGQTQSAESPNVPAGSNTPQVPIERAATLSPGITRMDRLSLDELIDETSMESFPASDAPSFSRR